MWEIRSTEYPSWTGSVADFRFAQIWECFLILYHWKKSLIWNVKNFKIWWNFMLGRLNLSLAGYFFQVIVFSVEREFAPTDRKVLTESICIPRLVLTDHFCTDYWSYVWAWQFATQTVVFLGWSMRVPATSQQVPTPHPLPMSMVLVFSLLISEDIPFPHLTNLISPNFWSLPALGFLQTMLCSIAPRLISPGHWHVQILPRKCR